MFLFYETQTFQWRLVQEGREPLWFSALRGPPPVPPPQKNKQNKTKKQSGPTGGVGWWPRVLSFCVPAFRLPTWVFTGGGPAVPAWDPGSSHSAGLGPTGTHVSPWGLITGPHWVVGSGWLVRLVLQAGRLPLPLLPLCPGTVCWHSPAPLGQLELRLITLNTFWPFSWLSYRLSVLSNDVLAWRQRALCRQNIYCMCKSDDVLTLTVLCVSK